MVKGDRDRANTGGRAVERARGERPKKGITRDDLQRPGGGITKRREGMGRKGKVHLASPSGSLRNGTQKAAVVASKNKKWKSAVARRSAIAQFSEGRDGVEDREDEAMVDRGDDRDSDVVLVEREAEERTDERSEAIGERGEGGEAVPIDEDEGGFQDEAVLEVEESLEEAEALADADAEDVARIAAESQLRPETDSGEESGSDPDEDELARTLRFQKKQIALMEEKHGGRRANKSKQGKDRDRDYARPGFKENWENTIGKYENEFFTSGHAKMRTLIGRRNTHTSKSAKNAYRGVKLTEHNCKDIAYCLRNKFGTGFALDNPRSEAFAGFKGCIGQLVRLAIATKYLNIRRAWIGGEVFEHCTNEAVLDVFLHHFKLESTHATLTNKAQHCATLVSQAMSYFRSRPRREDETAEERECRIERDENLKKAYNNVMKKAAHGKKEARIRRKISRSEKNRKAEGNYLTEQDIEGFQKEAAKALAGIIVTFQNARSDAGVDKRDYEGCQKIVDEVLKKKDLLDKWCLNFLVLCMVYGCGQRNQVYTQLVSPSHAELENFKEEKGGSKARVPVEIPIGGMEKTKRDIHVPNVLLDPKTFSYVLFHTKYVLPHMHGKFQIGQEDERKQWLLLHSRNGHQLSSDQVRQSLITWVRDMDSELHLTPMHLRCAYATIQVRKYDEGSHLSHIPKKKFMEMVASVMNTSVEQIENIYASETSGGFTQQVAEVLGVVDTGNESEDAGAGVEDDL